MFDFVNNLGGTFYIFLFTIIFCIVYQCVLRTWFYFSSRNIKFVRGLPIIGSNYRTLIGLESAATAFQTCYEQYPKEKFIGLYGFFGKPSYLIIDPELVKQITITDFDHFVNHKFTFDSKNEPLLNRSLFAVHDERWRELRATISPAFTGSKMRLMLDLVVKYTKEFIATLKVINTDTNTFNTKELFSRYANDVIATVAFGIELNSLKEPKNEFFQIGQDITNITFYKGLKFIGSLGFPALMKLLKIRIISEESSHFMRDIILNNISFRKEKQITRNDMIDLLIKARAGQLQYDDENNDDVGFAIAPESNVGKSTKKITNLKDEDIVAQCTLFLFAGFDTVSTTISFMFHELAVNPDIQHKLYKEIVTIKNELNGKPLNYETIQKMKYLDMVLSESMRRWSTVPVNDRACTKPYVLENADGSKAQLNVGDTVLIPLYALQMDERYFPNAETFDPERFSDENKHLIQPGTYMPFGIGPRNCIGSRFAIMEIKTLTYYLLSEFIIDKSVKTQDPLVLRANPFQMDAERGFYIDLRRRH